MSFHREYRDAFNTAIDLSRQLQREVGIERVDNPLDGKGYRVIHLPKPENRCGFELRCQVVSPSEPRMA